MKFSSPILTKLKGFTSRGGGASGASILPSREWGVSLLVSVLVAIGLFAFVGFDFYDQLTNRAVPEVSEEHIPKYRAQDAEFLIRYHEGRRESFDALRMNKPVVTTPVRVEEQPSTVTNEAESVGVASPVIAE